MHNLVSRRINAERLVMFGWSRAILLQLAHPLVAAGVTEHSSFRGGGISAILRLHHTIRVMLALVFGDESARRAALDGIRTIHRRVNGRLPAAAGIFPARTPYSAEDPDLVLWVHATLLESIPMVYELLVQPLSDTERDAYCAEGAAIAIELGARNRSGSAHVGRERRLRRAHVPVRRDCCRRAGARARGARRVASFRTPRRASRMDEPADYCRAPARRDPASVRIRME